MNITTLYDKVEKVASSLYSCALESSAETDSIFRTLVNVDFDGSLKPLLVVGTTHPYFGDGHCIAVLNPDKNLLNIVIAGVGYADFFLKEVVRGKCDLTLALWINTNVGFRADRTFKYKCRKASPARFSLEDMEIERFMNKP